MALFDFFNLTEFNFNYLDVLMESDTNSNDKNIKRSGKISSSTVCEILEMCFPLIVRVLYR